MRQFLYSFCSEAHRKEFVVSPLLFLRQEVPLRHRLLVALVGPELSGKATLAKRLAQATGFRCASICEIVETLLATEPHSSLAKRITAVLRAGQALPDSIAAEAVQTFLLDPMCQTRGLLLVGFPATLAQVSVIETYVWFLARTGCILSFARTNSLDNWIIHFSP